MKGKTLKNIEGVIFDLGGTLLYLQKDPIQMHEDGARLIYSYLKSLGLNLPPEGNLIWDLYKIRQHLSKLTASELKQYTASDAMYQLLETYNLNSIANDKIVKKMVSLYFHPEMDAYATPQAAQPLLQKLKSQGIRLGLLSNATDHDLIVLLLKKHGLIDYFDNVVTSVSAGFPKPHHMAYESVTKFWEFNSYENLVMVGDNVNPDLTGAKELGMTTIWLRPKHLEVYESNLADITVSSFGQLVTVFSEKH